MRNFDNQFRNKQSKIDKEKHKENLAHLQSKFHPLNVESVPVEPKENMNIIEINNRKEIDKLEKKIKELTNENIILRNSIKYEKETGKTLKQENYELKQIVKIQTENFELLSKEHSNTLNALNCLQNEIENLQNSLTYKQLKFLNLKLSNLENELNVTRFQNKQLQVKIENLKNEQRLKFYYNERVSLLDQIEEYKKQIGVYAKTNRRTCQKRKCIY